MRHIARSAAAVVLACATVATAATIHVPADQPTIQDGINAAVNGDEVVVAPGSYHEASVSFGGRAITVRGSDPNDWAVVEATVVDADAAGPVFNFGNGEDSTSVLSGLTVTDGIGIWGIGGGIYVSNCSPKIERCLITGNSASARGGGLGYYDAPNPIAVECRIEGNTTNGQGGGVSSYYGGTFRDCLFIDNTASSGGAAYSYTDGLTFINCVLANNTATGSGGAIHACWADGVVVTNCTIYGNSATGSGGTLHVSCPSTVAFKNSILWNALQGGQNEIDSGGYPGVSATYCDIQGGWGGAGNIASDPSLLDPAAGDYHLAIGSPCIDAGTASGAPAVDYEGDARPFDGLFDIGADEFTGPPCLLDLSVISFTPTLAVGEVLEIEAEVSNSCDISQDFNSVKVSAQGPASAEFYLINNVTVSLRPGETRARSLRKMIPFNAPPGDYDLTLEVLLDDFVLASEAFTITVTASGDIITVPGDFARIQDAIMVAADGDQVVVSPGTYAEWDIRLLGKAITVRGTDPADSATVAGTVVDAGGNGRGFYVADGEGHDTVISGLTIANGYAREGGGIGCWESAPTISRCVIRDCDAHAAGMGGGAIWGKDSDLVLDDCTLSGNSAVSYGGAISLSTASSAMGGILSLPATPEITDCRIEGNSAGSGAGLFFSNVRPAIQGCVLLANSATVQGGGIFGVTSAAATIEDCTFEGNVAGFGGGISLQRCQATIEGGSWLENEALEAFFGGGGIFADRTTLTLSGASFTLNSSGNDGGGLYLNAGSATIERTLIAESFAGARGGGICVASNPLTLTNCTVVDNDALEGAGIYAYSGGTTTGLNNIVTGAATALHPDYRIAMSYSLVEGGWSGEGNLDVDPLYRDPGSLDFHLQSIACGDAADSPAIDAGDPATADSLLGCDDGLGSGAADMGAYGGGAAAGASQTVLLLHGDGDQSASQHRLGAHGAPRLDAGVAKFGAGSCYFGGADFFTVSDHPDWDLGSDDFTIDFWMRPASSGDTRGLFALGKNSNPDWRQFNIEQRTDGRIRWNIQQSSSFVFDITAPSAPPLDQWSHIAAVRDGDDFRLFVNGTQMASASRSVTLDDYDDALVIGRRPELGQYNGHIDELRVSTGIARWTGDFTPPSAPHGDDIYTKLLFPMDGDESDSGHAVSLVGDGDVKLAADIGKWNGSFAFAGSPGHLSIPDHDDWYFDSDDFTIDLWVRFDTVANSGFVSQWDDGTNLWRFYFYSSQLRFDSYAFAHAGGSFGIYRSWVPATDTWYHLALTRSGGDWRLFVDGSQLGATETDSFTLPDLGSPANVGWDPDAGLYLDGQIDELRIAAGVAHWASNFTPPVAPY